MVDRVTAKTWKVVAQQCVSLYNPRQQIWGEHFTWSNDAQRVLGISPTGRATVEALKLNRDRVMNLRRVLSAMGEHPLD